MDLLAQAVALAALHGELTAAEAQALVARLGPSQGPPDPGARLRAAGLPPAQVEQVLARFRELGTTLAGRAARPDEFETQDGPPQLAGWRLEGVLGRGAMGAVHRAHRVEDPAQKVALKVLHDPDPDPTSRKRFQREAEALRRLDHPGVVRLVDAGTGSDGRAWLAMELVPGQPLSALLRDLDPRALAGIVAEVARALQHAHSLGVLHRDVKPSNIIVRTDGHPVLSDFGVARDLDRRSVSLTESGELVGTPLYLAPELCRGERATPRSDVYALGAVLYEGLTGRPPFLGSSLLDLLGRIQAGQPTPPAELRPDAPPDLARLSLRALAKDPLARPDAGELAAALEAWLRGGPPPPSPPPRAHPAPAAAAPPPRPTRAVRAALGLVGAASLLALALLAFRPAPPLPPEQRLLVLQPGPLGGQDAYVHDDGGYADDNFGLDDDLRVGARPNGPRPGDYRSYLRFELPALDSALERATLALWLSETIYGDEPLELVLQPVLAPWVEGTGLCDALLDGLAWTPGPGQERWAQPPPDPDPDRLVRLTLPAGHGPGWVELDVTASVAAWLAGAPNHGWRLARAQEGPPHQGGVKVFASSDAAEPGQRPRLVLQLQGAAPRPAHEDQAEALARTEAEALLERADRATDLEERWRLAQAAVERAPASERALLARARAGARLFDKAWTRTDLDRAERAAWRWNEPEAELEAVDLLRTAIDEAAGLARLAQARARFPDAPELRAQQLLLETEADRRADGEALAALPSGPDASWRVLLARSQASGDPAERLELLEAARHAVELEPPGRWSPEPALWLAVTLGGAGHPDEATRELTRLATRLAGDPLWLGALTDVYDRVGQVELLRPAYAAALARPRSPPWLREVARHYLPE